MAIWKDGCGIKWKIWVREDSKQWEEFTVKGASVEWKGGLKVKGGEYGMEGRT